MTSTFSAPDAGLAASSQTFDAYLELLAEMSRDFAASQDVQGAIYRALQRIIDNIDAIGGALFLLNDDGTMLRCHACVGATEIVGLELPSDMGIVGKCVAENAGTIVRDVTKDPNFYKGFDEQTGHTTRSILCAPLSVKDEKIGAIELIDKRSRDGLFSNGDLHLLETLASAAAMAIINTRQAAALVEQERVKRELELAREIQRSLLPADVEGVTRVQGYNRPAREVSGDFYDFFPLPDGRICFNIGDVSGKGMNAALLMAKTSSLYRCLGKGAVSPGYLLQEINREICETATRGMFITMIGGVYDPGAGTVRLCNAGHEPPMVVGKDGGVAALEAELPPLGVLDDPTDGKPFPEQEIMLDGGSLWMFTDGLTEGYRADGSELGREGVERILIDGKNDGLSARVAAVVKAVKPAEAGLRDDITVLAVDDSARRPAAAEPVEPPPSSEHLMHVRVPAKPDRLRIVRQTVRTCVDYCGGCQETSADVVLAVDEACQNIIRHAYAGREDGEIGLDICREDGCIVIYLRDVACPVDPETIKPRDLGDIRPGGLGVHIIQEVMDEAAYLNPPPSVGNLLRLKKRIS